MNAIADALEAQLSLVDWFKRVEPLAVLSASRALATFSATTTSAAKRYASMGNLSYQVDRKGLLIDRNV